SALSPVFVGGHGLPSGSTPAAIFLSMSLPMAAATAGIASRGTSATTRRRAICESRARNAPVLLAIGATPVAVLAMPNAALDIEGDVGARLRVDEGPSAADAARGLVRAKGKLEEPRLRVRGLL